MTKAKERKLQLKEERLLAKEEELSRFQIDNDLSSKSKGKEKKMAKKEKSFAKVEKRLKKEGKIKRKSKEGKEDTKKNKGKKTPETRHKSKTNNTNNFSKQTSRNVNSKRRLKRNLQLDFQKLMAAEFKKNKKNLKKIRKEHRKKMKAKLKPGQILPVGIDVKEDCEEKKVKPNKTKSNKPPLYKEQHPLGANICWVFESQKGPAFGKPPEEPYTGIDGKQLIALPGPASKQRSGYNSIVPWKKFHIKANKTQFFPLPKLVWPLMSCWLFAAGSDSIARDFVQFLSGVQRRVGQTRPFVCEQMIRGKVKLHSGGLNMLRFPCWIRCTNLLSISGRMHG